MAKIEYIAFDIDIIEGSLGHLKDCSVMVYPTMSSALLARKLFAPRWNLERIDFITMEELKNRMLQADMPILEDDKRLLCLYAVLSAEDKSVFHINNYDDMPGWGGHWFGFFEELCEERISVDTLINPQSIPAYYLQTWQEEFIRRNLDIRIRYKEYIEAKGFTDAIFAFENPCPCMPPLYNNYVFVNQFYYTKLEQFLIRHLEACACETLLLYHGPKEMVHADATDTADLKALLNSKAFNTKRIDFAPGGSEDQMIITYLQNNGSKEAIPANSALVDRLFYDKAYHKLFDPAQYKIMPRSSITESNIYRFLKLIETHQKELISEDNQLFLPLRSVQDALANCFFSSYFGLDTSACLAAGLELDSLIYQDFLYIDLQLKLFTHLSKKHQCPILKNLLEQYFGLLMAFCRVRSAGDLCALLDEDKGIKLAALMGEALGNSDILQKFWEKTANFLAIEQLGIVSDFSEIYGSEALSCATGILGLYLSYIKSARISYNYMQTYNPACSITNLMDSRNRSFQRLCFLNVIEGEIPSNPTPNWLLNETQRACLKLKTWKDIRNWERYYFFRLIFCSHDVRLYYYQSVETDTRPGSFVNILLQALDAVEEHGIELNISGISKPDPDILFKSLFSANRQNELISKLSLPGLEALKDESICLKLKPVSPSFFYMPYHKDQDFGGQNELNSGYYGLSALTTNAFAWYIEYLRKLKSNALPRLESTTRKVFGTILHGFVASAMNLYADRYPVNPKADPGFLDLGFLRTRLLELLKEPLYQYIIPKNYNREFLISIMADNLCESISWVFEQVLFANKDLMRPGTRILPEKDDYDSDTFIYKSILDADSNSEGIPVKTRCKADLRIETPSARYVIDFKTGKGSANQLALYEWYYYLADKALPDGISLGSMICNMLERNMEPFSDLEETRQKFFENIRQSLEDIFERGYGLPIKTTGRNTLANISRAELYKSSLWRLHV